MGGCYLFSAPSDCSLAILAICLRRKFYTAKPANAITETCTTARSDEPSHFAGIELPRVDYDALRAALTSNCLKAGYQPLESLLIKAIQLYEMIIVRHGLMLVGLSYGMKTVAYRMLAASLSGESPESDRVLQSITQALHQPDVAALSTDAISLLDSILALPVDTSQHQTHLCELAEAFAGVDTRMMPEQCRLIYLMCALSAVVRSECTGPQ
jgi:hypothetical protein